MEAQNSKQVVDTRPNVEHLIREGVYLQEQIEMFRKRLSDVRDALDPLFPADKTSEQLVTSVGTAQRKVQNKWKVHLDKVPAMHELLNDEFEDFLQKKIDYRTTAKLRKVVGDADNALGLALRPYVFIDQTVSIGFTAATQEEV